MLQGVASGDPTATSVILWTKFTSRTPTQPADLTWYISTRNDLSDATGRTRYNTFGWCGTVATLCILLL